MKKARAPLERSQTAIEYLLLIGASVIFTIIVTLATRDVIFPQGEIVVGKIDVISSAKASFQVPTATLAIPSPTAEVVCIPGQICGPPVCSGNLKCDQVCANTFVCGADPTTCSSCLQTVIQNVTCGDIPEDWVVTPCDRSCDNPCSNGACGSCVPPSCKAGCVPIVRSCVVSSNPSSEIGEFTSTITATFTNLPSGINNAILKCNDLVAAVPSDTMPIVGGVASRNDCKYPIVASSQVFTISAEATKVPKCTGAVIDSPLVLSANLCDVTKCEIAPPTPYDYDFYVGYDYSIRRMPVFDPVKNCNNGAGACKPFDLLDPSTWCRVHGARVGNTQCMMIEDSTDFDWDDFHFSTEMIEYPSGERLLSVTDESADTSARDELNLTFNFPTGRYVIEMPSMVPKIEQGPSFIVWLDPMHAIGTTKHYFISNDAAAPFNLPPILSIPDKTGVLPFPHGTSSFAIDDLTVYLTDESPSTVKFNLLYFDTSVLNCGLSGINNKKLSCQRNTNPIATNVIIRATDSAGMYSMDTFNVRVF